MLTILETINFGIPPYLQPMMKCLTPPTVHAVRNDGNDPERRGKEQRREENSSDIKHRHREWPVISLWNSKANSLIRTQLPDT